MAQFTNQATLTYNGLTTTSNVVSGEITTAISMLKNATKQTYKNKDIINYVISIQNNGTTDFNGLTLNDNLGAYNLGELTLIPLTYTGDPVLYYKNGVLQNAPLVAEGPSLQINNIDILAEGTTMLVYRVFLNEYAPLNNGGTITNIASLTGATLTEPITSTEVINVDPSTELLITKSVNPTTVVENGEITYTFTINNTGVTPATQNAGIIIEDKFNPVLNNITATLNGVTWPQVGNYIYNTSIGEFNTIAGRITVPAATITQNPNTGEWTVTPGQTILTITGTI